MIKLASGLINKAQGAFAYRSLKILICKVGDPTLKAVGDITADVKEGRRVNTSINF